MPLGLLSAPFVAMSDGIAPERSEGKVRADSGRVWRVSALVAGCIALLVFVLPPVSTLARRYEFVQSLQYSFFIAGIPALIVIGAPWRFLRLSVTSIDEIRTRPLAQLQNNGLVDRWSAGRMRHLQPWRSVGVFIVYVITAVLWRTSAAMDALVGHPWLLAVEAITLLASGIWLWTELVESSPLVPRLVRPHRIWLASFSMWIIWVLAYFLALSHGVWYSAYHHQPGVGVSLSADQQMTAGMMWLVSGMAYISLIFWNLYKWLQSEEDPSDELHQLIRFERMRRGAGDTSGIHS